MRFYKGIPNDLYMRIGEYTLFLKQETLILQEKEDGTNEKNEI